jgi:sulfane dehydrogenase subunit SoxC
MWVKWLRRLKIGDAPWQTREETSKYTDLLADGRARRFTWVMDAKSVITAPSPQAPVVGHLAARDQRDRMVRPGSITRVDVSLDGGRNWVEARLDGPVFLVVDAVLRRYRVARAGDAVAIPRA